MRRSLGFWVLLDLLCTLDNATATIIGTSLKKTEEHYHHHMNDLRLPVAIFHGMTAQASIETEEIQELKKVFPNAQFKSFEYARNLKTIYIPVVRQSEIACELVKDSPMFQRGNKNNSNSSSVEDTEMVIIGHSNGGLVSRWVLQNCDLPRRVAYYISVGGPQRGITNIPRANMPTWSLPLLDWIVRRAYLLPWVQHLIGPAGYVYNPDHLNDFRMARTFLALLNNEADDPPLLEGGLEQFGGAAASSFKSPTFQKQRILDLRGMLLLQFTTDNVVVPRASEWFGQTQEDGHVYHLWESGRFWDEDLLGLKALAKRGVLKKWLSKEQHDRPSQRDRMGGYVPMLAGQLDKLKDLVPKEKLESSEKKLLKGADQKTVVSMSYSSTDKTEMDAREYGDIIMV